MQPNQELSAGPRTNDDDGDDMSPRTLQQAADRLAKFTSDQPAGRHCSFFYIDPDCWIACPAVTAWFWYADIADLL